MRNWYTAFYKYVDRGDCFLQRDGLKPFEKVIDPEIFYVCLHDFFLDESGDGMEDDMRFSDDANPIDRRILGFKTRIT